MLTKFRELKREFAALIREVDAEITPFTDAIDLEEISSHNAGYEAYAANKFEFFVEHEKNRFVLALDLIRRNFDRGVVCDLGCFVPYLPVALATLGYRVKIVDKYSLYGPRLRDSIGQIAARRGIQVFDLDILNDGFSMLGKNDVVLLMAVVEHLNGSPRQLMEKVRDIISEDGFLLFEVPNLAEFTRRIALLSGRSILPDYSGYFASAYPFLGHNREMTVAEVVYLFANTGYEIEQLFCYDYAGASPNGWKGRLLRVVKAVAPLRNKKQVIRAKAHPRR